MDENATESQQSQPESQSAQPAVDPAAGFTAPDGYELHPKGYGEKAQRWQQQAAGSQKFFETAKQYGIENVDGLKELGETFKTLRDRGVDPKALRGMFAEQDGGQQRQKPEIDLDQIMSRLDERVDKRVTETNARAQYQQDATAARSLVKELAGKLAPEGSSEAMQKFVADAFQSRYAQAQDQSLYPEGHPLHQSHLKPLGREDIAKVYEQTKADVTAILGAQGLQVAKSKPVSTPAGKRGTEGTDDDANLTPHERARLNARTRMEAVLNKHRNNGQPASAAG